MGTYIRKNYEYIYCLWVAGSFKGKGIGKELLEYAINDSKEKGMSGICTLTSKKKKPFINEKKFFEHYAYGVCKIFVLCNVIGGKFTENIETTEIKYFSLDEISDNLAEEKSNVEQIRMCFKAIEDENWQTQFD